MYLIVGDEGVLLPVRVRSGDLRIQRTKRGVNLAAGFPWGVASFASLNSFGPMGNLRLASFLGFRLAQRLRASWDSL